MCNIIVPPTVNPRDLYIPSDWLEYLIDVIKKTDIDLIADLSYKDYENEWALYTSHFENLFYHMDLTLRYVKTQQEVGEPDIPTRSVMTLIEYRHGCVRDYESFQVLCKIFLQKAFYFIVALSAQDNVIRPYYIKRLHYIVSDVETLLHALYERNHSNT